jgi:hypothetical protein
VGLPMDPQPTTTHRSMTAVVGDEKALTLMSFG